MKGFRRFFGETWWVFATVAVLAVVVGYFTGIWLYYLFPPMLIVVAVYMATVRYDADGNLREEKRMR